MNGAWKLLVNIFTFCCLKHFSFSGLFTRVHLQLGWPRPHDLQTGWRKKRIFLLSKIFLCLLTCLKSDLGPGSGRCGRTRAQTENIKCEIRNQFCGSVLNTEILDTFNFIDPKLEITVDIFNQMDPNGETVVFYFQKRDAVPR